MKIKVSFISLLLAASVAATGAQAATTTQSPQQYGAAEAQGFVDKSVKVIEHMQSNPNVATLLGRARGVLIVPSYLKAALIVGGQGGVGVLMGRHAGRWSGPAFFSISGLSVGFQAGGDAGAVAYMLMTDRAVRDLENRKSTFRLGGDAGLTVARFSDSVMTGPTPDVIVWTATEGLFGGVAFNGTDVATNYRLDQVYYQRPVSVSAILDDSVQNPRAHPLQLALSAPPAQPR